MRRNENDRRRGWWAAVVMGAWMVVLAVPSWNDPAGVAEADEAVPNDPQPRWWKGNLHTHTFWSDGDDFPEMVANWYRNHGYHFLALSDHNVLAQGIRWDRAQRLRDKGGPRVIEKYLARFGPSWVEQRGEGDEAEVRLKPLDEFRALVEQRGRFLMIPAEEISDKVGGLPLHINASNIRDPLTPVGGSTISEAITNNLRAVEEQAERAGREILAHLNHPNFHYAVTAHDLAHAVMERHFEVYNGHPHVNHLGDGLRPGVERIWDIANTIRLVDLAAPPLYGVATDDAHNYHPGRGGSRPGRGWVMVRATHLTPESIIRALKAGDCYASSGVTLRDVRFDPEARILRVEVEPDEGADYVIDFIGTLRGVDPTGVPIEPKPETEAAATEAPAKGRPDAAELARHRRYSDRIGEVLASSSGTVAEYALSGEELYVRAVVTSSLPPKSPVWKEQRQQAWTQPVGWELPPAAPR
jgi:predicted metal-dependent phosphoesterase TrpH